jgi:hypothetical protein
MQHDRVDELLRVHAVHDALMRKGKIDFVDYYMTKAERLYSAFTPAEHARFLAELNRLNGREK